MPVQPHPVATWSLGMHTILCEEGKERLEVILRLNDGKRRYASEATLPPKTPHSA
jgi:hypothetical protein